MAPSTGQRAKTGTDTQRDLVRLLSTIPGIRLSDNTDRIEAYARAADEVGMALSYREPKADIRYSAFCRRASGPLERDFDHELVNAIRASRAILDNKTLP